MPLIELTPTPQHPLAWCTTCGGVVLLENPNQDCPVCWYIRAEIEHAIKNHAGPR